MNRTRKLKNINPSETFEWINFRSEELEKRAMDMVLDDMESQLIGNIWIIEATVDIKLTVGRVLEEVTE